MPAIHQGSEVEEKKNPTIITPTIGRKVWYVHDNYQTIDAKGNPVNVVSFSKHPMDATVIHVWSDRNVSLRITDHGGTTFALHSITLVQEGDPIPMGRHCIWMPHQLGQAKRA